ncbi:MAG: hypothetical protein QF662_06330, partial [Phycisphaerae bacterium]|nr:hypothetical protein [Phycisphaerae bacterium]
MNAANPPTTGTAKKAKVTSKDLLAPVFDGKAHADIRWRAAARVARYKRSSIIKELTRRLPDAKDVSSANLQGWALLTRFADYSDLKGLEEPLLKILTEGEGTAYELDFMVEGITTEDVVWPALEALGRIKSHRAAQILVDLLDGNDMKEWGNRAGIYGLCAGGIGAKDKGRVLRGLASVGRSEDAVRPIKYLADGQEWVRDEASY